MTNPTRIIIAGIGPGNPELVTLDALNEARNADMILVPRSKPDVPGIAETVLTSHIDGRNFTPILFPMTKDSATRDEIIISQVESLSHEIEGKRVFFPVIGDSMLYSTGAYFLEAVRKIIPDVQTRFIPGVSAHSVASSCAGKFLAVSDDILTIIPGTASPERIATALSQTDTAAIYKPTAIRDIHSLVDPSKFRTIIRVDHAGIPGRERVIHGSQALNDISEYMSVLLLRR